VSTGPDPQLSLPLREKFRSAWGTCRVLFFSAPCGSGKTTAAGALLKDAQVCRLNAADADICDENIPRDCEAVLVEDMQYLTEPERQQKLCVLIRQRTQLHFVLLSRGRVPGWLMPFDLSGMMAVFSMEDLFFDSETTRRMLESRGVAAAPEEISSICRTFGGYPLGMELLSRELSGGRPYGPDALADTKRGLFAYYDEAVLHRFPPPLRMMLIYLAPFEKFDVGLAGMACGDKHAGELLGAIERDTSMLLFDGMDTYSFLPIFREYLLRKFELSAAAEDRAAVYSRAALYYELRGDYESALGCYSRTGRTDRVSALLIKNAGLHPGVGHYREMQDYYFALPRQTILQSPVLICGMSMLTALTMDYAASEEWYGELREYAARLKKDDPEYREARSRLAYLDIALPQRGSRGLIPVINGVFRVMLDKKLDVPAFSVTSTLPSIMNGGKDFCEWSKRDDMLYATMRAPVEAVLGRDGIGLADCAICESKFEKGADISERMLTLMARLGEIQTRGTPDIEFAVMGLLCRAEVSKGRAGSALQSIESLREKYERSGESRFIDNIDALCTRIRLRLGDDEAARDWLENRAPKNDARLWAMWRYQYLTRVMVQLAQGGAEEPLLLLARLLPYCSACGRVMDELHIHLLAAICRRRMGSEMWEKELAAALDISWEYKFIWPAAQYGAAILPLLRESGWEKDPAFLNKLRSAAKAQAVYYPHFLRPGAKLTAPLSASEIKVLRLLCRDLSNREICGILNISLATVKTHVSHILQKLNVRNRSEAKAAAAAMHLT
jgi:LuxR family maltose regulon positive regulatory protein